MLKKKEWFIGTWQIADESSFVILKISAGTQNFIVRPFCKDDGEELVVSKVQYLSGALSFETYVPSNKYRTKNRLVLSSKTKLVQEVTFKETWKKCNEPSKEWHRSLE